MQLLILISAALGLGYWLSRSKYHESIDNAAQQPINWWQRLVLRSGSSDTTVDQTNPEQAKES